MHERCTHCHLRYQREPGFFLGSIYINYGLTALLVTIGYLSLFFAGFDPQVSLIVVMAFAVLFPLWFFRYSRSLWLAFDQYWDPTPPDAPAERSWAEPRE